MTARRHDRGEACRHGLLLAALVLTTAAATSAAAEPRAGRGGVRTVPIDATFVEPSPQLDGVSCTGLAAGRVADDTCRQRITGVSYFTGDVRGTERYSLDTWLRRDARMGYEGPARFTDTVVRGCGRGGFVIEVHDGVLDLPGSDVATGRTSGVARWRLLPYSGTGDLAGRLVGGGGVTTFVSRADRSGSTADDYAEGALRGTVTCRR